MQTCDPQPSVQVAPRRSTLATRDQPVDTARMGCGASSAASPTAGKGYEGVAPAPGAAANKDSLPAGASGSASTEGAALPASPSGDRPSTPTPLPKEFIEGERQLRNRRPSDSYLQRVNSRGTIIPLGRKTSYSEHEGTGLLVDGSGEGSSFTSRGSRKVSYTEGSRRVSYNEAAAPAALSTLSESDMTAHQTSHRSSIRRASRVSMSALSDVEETPDEYAKRIAESVAYAGSPEVAAVATEAAENAAALAEAVASMAPEAAAAAPAAD